ncbi:YbfB/YjiJ family MFS transporter [Verminephrobacter eiseniae]|uniref:YbfB/YjiJ family MFS transporter n=1 Tax=Verminephrobacter eiseniae TaxID=364317 RepID=UPI002237D2FA|nr:YbfB/YjiJ family MFS transporter [Verminephrobacter eiseniae]MCW5236871.1 YbfB/YjiJ family MFS transporter [Verminephrobacter eiseniae]
MNTARLLVPLAAAALAVDIGVARLGYGLTLPAMRVELPGSFGLYGVIATLHLGSYLVGSMLTPLMLRRLSWRAVFVLAHLLVALGLLAQAQSASVEMLAAVRVFLGLATGLGVLSALGSALESVEPQRRMAASAIIWTGVAVGMVLSAPAGSWALEQAGRWRTVSMGCAVPALVFALIGGLVAFPTNAAARAPAPKVRIIDGLRQLRDSTFLLWAYALYGFAYFVYATFVLARLVGGLAGTGATAVWLWTAFGATAAIGSLALPLIMHGRLRSHAMTATVGIGALGALTSLGGGNGFAIAGAMLVGLGLTATPAVASAYARERVDTVVGPSALAVATIACAAGQMAGPILTGVVIDVFGLESMTVLVLVGYTLAAVFAKLDQLHQMRMRQSS